MKWWQKENIYQIYLRSFNDSNHDGIGDLRGVEQKLDYLKDLGVDILWISPHYDSPMDDNGYDVRDFYQVSSDYGTIESFQSLIRKAHEKDMKIVTDLVLNHTSDEHPWFLAAKDPNHPQHQKYHDYYIWQKGKTDSSGKRIRPTRWIGWFGSPAWDYNEATDEYYLHIFSKKMPDLNWRNESLRNDIKSMISWWLDLGIDGFRVDASNHLEKNWNFPDSFPGYENFSSIPKHHEYLRELGNDIFSKRDAMTIGESGGASKEEALQYAGYGSNEFNMLIQFGHCWADVDNHHPLLMGKWAQGQLHVSTIKQSFQHWYDMLSDKGWKVIYWHNHDQPRVLSHYGSEQHREKSGKMLAISLYMMSGTAICYQGEEIGMTNVKYNSLSQFRDVEVFTEYQNMLDKNMSKEESLEVIKARCRDNARTPMQWNDSQYAGFSDHYPWIDVNSDYDQVNVSFQQKNPNSIYQTYKWVLHYRKEHEDVFNGNVKFIHVHDDVSYAYLNRGKKEEHLVLCNFTDHEIQLNLSEINLKGFECIYSNTDRYVELQETLSLEGYDALVFYRKIG